MVTTARYRTVPTLLSLYCYFLSPQPPLFFSPKPWLLATTNTNLFSISNFVVSRMFYKWNHIVSNLLRLAFKTQHNSLEIHRCCCMSSIACFFLLLSSISWYRCTTVCLTIPSLKDIGSLSVLGHFYWSCCEHSCTGFHVNINSHFSGINKCPRRQLLVCMVSTCLFM